MTTHHGRTYRGKLILLLEKNDEFRRFMADTLIQNGHVVETCLDLPSAMSILAQKSFDLVFADTTVLSQDFITGFSLLKKDQPQALVVIMTASPSVEQATELIRQGAYDYVQKPFPAGVLLRVTGRALETKELLDQNRSIEAEKIAYQQEMERLLKERTQWLSESEERFTSLFNTSKDAAYITDRTGLFIEFNQSLQDLLGYDRDELLLMRAGDLFLRDEDRDLFADRIQREGAVRDFEVGLRHKSGSLLVCLLASSARRKAKGDILGFQGIIHDITARKAAENGLRRNEAKFRDFFLNAPFIMVSSDENGIVDVNRMWTAQTGFSAEDALGKPLHFLAASPPEDHYDLEGGLQALQYLRRDGTAMDILAQSSTSLDSSGRPISLTVIRDVTERKRLESIAVAANLMDNIGFIFSGIRHEIGNPINTIKMTLMVLQKNLTTYPPEKINEFIDRAVVEVGRLEYLLKALKNFSLFEQPSITVVDMATFLEKFLALAGSDLQKKGITVQVKPSQEKLLGRTDARALQQVLLNILVNAADALTDRDEPAISISLEKKRGLIQLMIKDNGRGMSPEEQAHLFKPFYTTKEQGTGLGLVIVRKMLSSMNSAIEIVSRRDFGTTVTISLPEGKSDET